MPISHELFSYAMKLTRKKKILLLIIASMVAAIGLDMAIARSVYHPLNYLYSMLSWTSCRIFPCYPQDTKAVKGGQAMVVTSHAEASRVGQEILLAGGNAIDAAVGVGYALAVVEPCCGNIGGGGFMVIHRADGEEIFLNFRETAPLAASADMYLNAQGEVIPDLSTQGYLAVGIPGTVAGLDTALSEYGTMTRQQVMAGAIRLAQEGFRLSAGDIERLHPQTKVFSQQQNVAAIFLRNGKPYQVGEQLVQGELGQTLRAIASSGASAFYQGKIVRAIVQASQENGGILSVEDFARYRVNQEKPLQCEYRGYEVVTAPPPGGGVTVCQILNVLEGYPLSQFDWHSTESLHYFLSAALFAYADRNQFLGDPDFIDNPVERLLSEDYAARIRGQIGEKAIDPRSLFLEEVPQGTHTTHYSIVDRFGNAVAVTYTINSLFGAKVIAKDTGFFLNNEMDDFMAKPGKGNQFGLVQGEANQIEPGKQPLSSMSPTIVKQDEEVVLVTGSPGGATIPTTVVQVITNLIDYDLDIEGAVNAPRIHYQGLPNWVLTEPFALEPEVIPQLWERGYRVIPFTTWGAAESIGIEPEVGVLWGVNDKRRVAGKALGY
ncbi:gamma-glutamyltransferase [Coleofasciculus sp.]|uniref:gamma-glutamyltransferase n=1 Tax=Coleofasciculus sp. TaxID=3100458 RepID=UPI0039FAF38E